MNSCRSTTSSGSSRSWPRRIATFFRSSRSVTSGELKVSEDKPYPSLQKWLAENYSGRTMTFEELLNEDYPRSGVWVEMHYRWAVLDMAEREDVEPRVTITRNRTTPSGKPPRGLKLPTRSPSSGRLENPELQPEAQEAALRAVSPFADANRLSQAAQAFHEEKPSLYSTPRSAL